MKRSKCLLLLLFLLCPFAGYAQQALEKYTEKLQEVGPGGAVVIVHQDEEIDKLVNPSATSVVRTTTTTKTNTVRKVEKPTGTATRQKDVGYRIQIIMAGNTVEDKTKVKSIAKRFKNYFPSVNAYVYFSSPHWVCSVGDFREREDATSLLSRVRATSQFNSACIVKSKINASY